MSGDLHRRKVCESGGMAMQRSVWRRSYRRGVAVASDRGGDATLRHGWSDGKVGQHFMARCTHGSAVGAHGARWRWSSDAWAPTQKAETDWWDPAAELFLC
jgi:hypothetical protein